MYNCCKKDDFIKVVTKNGTIIKGFVIEIKKIPNEWRNIITLKKAYVKHITQIDMSADIHMLDSADISIIGIEEIP